jgi:COP9 signalosome complex subunit 4
MHCAECGAACQRLQVCYARILDSKRKFLEAATRYYELSQLETLEVAGKV